MNEQRPRRINTGSAQQKNVYRPSGAPAPRQKTLREKPREEAFRAAVPRAEPGQPSRRKKRSGKKRGCLLPFFVTVGALAAIVLIAWRVVMSAIAPNAGAFSLNDLVNTISTPTEYKNDVINILLVGVDWEEGRAYSNDPSSNDGLTDMIMYINFDVKNKTAQLLQIPRNTFVGGTVTTNNGTYSANNGQINSLLVSNDEGIAALADVVSYQLGLPIDNYIEINMQAMKEVVDLFGGVEVYVPFDMEYKGSMLRQGYQTLDGDAAEFFVRLRHGANYNRGDLDRLNTQRYFYSGLLAKIRTMTLRDAVKLTPAFMNYVTTDLSTADMASLGVSLLKTDSANIMLCQLPEYMGGERYYINPETPQSVLVGAPDAAASLLNQYFRTYTGEVPASDLHFTPWSTVGEPSDPNVQYMGQLDSERQEAQQTNNLDGSNTVTADNQNDGTQ